LGGFFVKGKQTYDVWEYGADIIFVFADRRLAAWKTEMTVSQLQQWSTKRAQLR
jgi:hypothetical protein